MSIANKASRFGLTPELRFEMVLDYAAKVLGDMGAAKAWIEAPHHRIRQGEAAIAKVCRTSEGFREAMAVLHRMRLMVSSQPCR